MDEQQILKQLNRLGEEVKPREKWVNMTKRELFEEDQQQQEAAATLISRAFSPLQKPVMALTALGLIALTLGSAMFYSPQLVEVDQEMPEINSQDKTQQRKMVESLKDLSNGLEKINRNLREIEDSKNLASLVKVATIQVTAESVQETAQEMSTSTNDPQTLAALSKIEESSKQTIENSRDTFAKVIKESIDNLDKNKEYLSSKDQMRLKEAQNAYQNGNYMDAYLLLKNIKVL